MVVMEMKGMRDMCGEALWIEFEMKKCIEGVAVK
jgi:hypothetical protein